MSRCHFEVVQKHRLPSPLVVDCHTSTAMRRLSAPNPCYGWYGNVETSRADPDDYLGTPAINPSAPLRSNRRKRLSTAQSPNALKHRHYPVVIGPVRETDRTQPLPQSVSGEAVVLFGALGSATSQFASLWPSIGRSGSKLALAILAIGTTNQSRAAGYPGSEALCSLDYI